MKGTTGNITRFKPTRAGIINLWDYVDEIFEFADGRLVLRGHNGAGKTKALEVLFPFVLDGRTDPRRLDPFSGENRTMKDNLLYRGNDAGYGYVWMEFSRIQDGQKPERVTVGIGLQARRHKEGVTPWFFVSDGAVGDDFSLVVDQRPLTYKELIDLLGTERVMQKARDYRERIDQRLFGLGSERYEQMLELVLTLRKPQLSKDLDPEKLSKVLSRGLRPLDDELLEKVAKSFEDLELAQRELDQLVAADATLQLFITTYRGHIRAVARHRIDQVRAASNAVKERQGDFERKRAAFDAAVDNVAKTANAVRETKLALDAVRTRKEGLIESPAYKAITELDGKREHLRTATTAASNSERAASTLKASVETLRGKAETASQALSVARRDSATLAGKLLVAAGASGVEWTSSDGDGPPDEVGARLTARLGARRADLRAVRNHLERVDEGERKAAAADEQLQQAREKLAAAEQRQRDAEAALERARQALIAALNAWAAARPHGIVDAADLDALVEAVPALGESAAPTLRELLSVRLVSRVDFVGRQISDLERRIAELDVRDAELVALRDATLAHKEDAPKAVATRPDPRTARSGAPLWRLVRFRDGVGEREQAGIEAALEATGILDAWVMPSVEDSISGIHDAFLVSRPGPDAAGTLAEVLVTEDQPHVPPERVAELLRSIAYPLDAGVAQVAVTDDGVYRIGTLAGAYAVESARYIGATARAAYRQRKVEGIERERVEIASKRATFTTDLDGALARQKAFGAATSELPAVIGVLQTVRAIDAEAGAVRAERANEGAANEKLNHWKRESNDRRVALRREAATRALPADAVGVEAIGRAVDTAEECGEELVRALARIGERVRESSDWSAQAIERSEELSNAESEQREYETARDRLANELATLQANLGASAETLQSELAEIAEQIPKLERAEEAQTKASTAAIETKVGAERDVEAATSAVSGAETEHRNSMSALLTLAEADLAALLEIDPGLANGVASDAPTSPEALALFGAIEAKTRNASGGDDRRKSAMSQLSNSLPDLTAKLGAHYRPAWELDGDILRVRIADDEGETPAAIFASKLGARRREQEALLTVREREVFENSLLSSMCRQLNTRTTAARDLVRQMDRSMRDRKMSSGKTVGVRWALRGDLSVEQKTVVGHLEHDPVHLAAEQLDELRAHFLKEVRTARQSKVNQSYRDILAIVLDYRAWREFVLYLVDASGHEDTLTKARHSKLSGGEKAASLHLPLFAAAHAQFSSAQPTCPRLVALDEAFAGIDSQGKPELMSLSVEFDLDLFMTGFDLWVAFPGVPSAAHYDLVHVPTENTVSTMLLLWDGTEIVEGERAESLIRSAAGR